MTVHPAALPVEILLKDCDHRFTRRSGPGGQNRNKVETAVIVTHRPSGFSAEANERRTQQDNRLAAVKRLRLRLAVKLRGPAGEPGTPVVASALWQSRCREGRIQINPAHDDFPALLAEALDALQATGFDLPTAAAGLGCTSTQIVKLLSQEPPALLWMNEEREARGLPRLR